VLLPFEHLTSEGVSLGKSRAVLEVSSRSAQVRLPAQCRFVTNIVFLLLLVIEVLIVGLLLAALLEKTEGVLVYTLDDPYIALAISEAIANGGYGINEGEFAAASSSILYPLLLAPLAGTGMHVALPLALNVIGAITGLWALSHIAEISEVAPSVPAKLLLVFLLGACAFYINFYGLAFAGLEHSLHVGVSLLVLAGLIELTERNETPWWFLSAVVLATLLRFEGIVASGSALVILLLAGKIRHAIYTGIALAICVGFYFVWMQALDLPLLPASITLKSPLAAHASQGSADGILKMLTQRLTEPPRPALVLFALATAAMLGPIANRQALTLRHLMIPIFVASVTVGHALGGGFNWFERYDVYALAVGMGGMLYIYRSAWRWIFSVMAHPIKAWKPFVLAVAAYLCVILAVVRIGEKHAWATRAVPAAASNVYEQHAQMSRFLIEFYQAPVAVNDLGYVAWRNPYYVLDIFGLGSEEVRLAKQKGQPVAEWLTRLTQQHDIGLVMIYAEWFPERPKSWLPVARLSLGSPRTVAGGDTVTFFRTPVGSKEGIENALRRLQVSGLPNGVVLDLLF
jgi:hypothetical protein